MVAEGIGGQKAMKACEHNGTIYKYVKHQPYDIKGILGQYSTLPLLRMI